MLYFRALDNLELPPVWPYRSPIVEEEEEQELETEENGVRSSSVQSPRGRTQRNSRCAKTMPLPVDDYNPAPFAQPRQGPEVPPPENSNIDSWLLSTLQNSGRLTPYLSRNILHEHRLTTFCQGAGPSKNLSPQGPLPCQSETHRREVLSSMMQRYTLINVHKLRNSRMGASDDIELLDDSPEANNAAFAVLRSKCEQLRLTRKPPRRGLIIPNIMSINIKTERAAPPASLPLIPPRPDSFDEIYDLTPSYQRRFRRDPDRSEPDPRPLASGAPVGRVLVRLVRRPVPKMREVARGCNTGEQPPLRSLRTTRAMGRPPQRIQPSENREDVSSNEKDNAAISTLGPIEVGLAVVKGARKQVVTSRSIRSR